MVPPEPLAFLDPPLRYGYGFGNPLCSLVAKSRLCSCDEFFWRPRRYRLQLHGIIDSIGDTVLNDLVERNDQAPVNIGRCDTEHTSTRVDNRESPGASVTIGLLVGSDKRLTLIIVDQIGSDVGIVLVEGAAVDEKVEDGWQDGDGGGVGVVLDSGEVGVSEGQADTVVGDELVLVCALLASIILEGVTVVTGEDDECLIGDALFVEKVHQASHPAIVVADSVHVPVEVVVLLVHTSVRHVIVVGITFRQAPCVVGGASEVRQPHALVVGGGVGDELLEVGHKDGLGVGEVIDLLVKNVGLVVAPVILELLLGDDVLESQLGIELLLAIVLLNFGFEEGSLPLQVAEVGVGRRDVLLDLVEHAQNLRNARLVAVGIGFGELLNGHGVGTTVIGAVALGRHGGGSVSGSDVDTTETLLSLVVPCVVGGCVGLAILVGETLLQASDLLNVRHHPR